MTDNNYREPPEGFRPYKPEDIVFRDEEEKLLWEKFHQASKGTFAGPDGSLITAEERVEDADQRLRSHRALDEEERHGDKVYRDALAERIDPAHLASNQKPKPKWPDSFQVCGGEERGDTTRRRLAWAWAVSGFCALVVAIIWKHGLQ